MEVYWYYGQLAGDPKINSKHTKGTTALAGLVVPGNPKRAVLQKKQNMSWQPTISENVKYLHYTTNKEYTCSTEHTNTDTETFPAVLYSP